MLCSPLPWVTLPYFSFHQEKEEEGNLQAAYHDLQTDTIQLEERNVFCGSYNIRVLTDRYAGCARLLSALPL